MAKNDLRAKLELFLELSGEESLLHLNENLDLSAKKIKHFGEAAEEVNKKTQKGMVKTSLASQEMIRIIQDAPFGLFGVTNNIQALFDQLANQARKTGQSMTSVFMTSLRGIMTGPMGFAALAAIITTVALQWDKLSGMVDKFGVALGTVSAKQATVNNLLRETRDLLEDIRTGKYLADAISEIDTKDEVIARLQEEAIQRDLVNEQLDKFKQHHKDLIPVYERLQEIERDKIPNVFQVLEKSQLDRHKDDQDFEQFKRLTEAADKSNVAITALEKRLTELSAREDFEGIIIEGEKPRKDRTKEKEIDIKAAEFQLLQAKVDAMEEGLGKEIAQIAINSEKRLEAFEGTNDQEIKFRVAEEQRRNREIANAIEKQNKKDQKEEEKRLKEQARKRAKFIRAETKRITQEAEAKKFGAQSILFSAIAGSKKPQDRIKAQTQFALAQIDVEINRLEKLKDLHKDEETLLKRHNAEIKSLQAKKKAIMVEGAKDQTDTVRSEIVSTINILNSSLGNVGDTFGNLATVFAKESEKGLEQQKGFLKAQAIMQAIAASANITSQILSFPDGTPPPLKIGYAFAAGASVLTNLMATIRKINTSGSNSSSAGSIGGGFTSLNSFITSDRVSNLQQQNANRSRRRSAVMNEDRTLKVVYDDKTAGDITRKGMNYEDKTTR